MRWCKQYIQGFGELPQQAQRKSASTRHATSGFWGLLTWPIVYDANDPKWSFSGPAPGNWIVGGSAG